jgi:hypothetical protein
MTCLRIIDLEAVNGRTVGERGIRRADLFDSREQRCHAARAESRRDIARNPAAGLDRAEQLASDRVEQAELEVREDVARDGGDRELGNPLTELRRNEGTIRLHVHRAGLLDRLFEKGQRVEGGFVDRDPEPWSAWWRDVAVLHDKIGVRYQRIGTDGSEPKDEFTSRHHVRCRPTCVEMRAGGCFNLRQHGKAAAIDLNVRGFRYRGDLARWRDATMFVGLDASTSAASAAMIAWASWIERQASSAISGTPVAARLMAAMPARSWRFTGCSM